eukprot:Skav205497  [mRNA]  locus=scaffold231:26455:31423:- [translate_table: standard]
MAFVIGRVAGSIMAKGWNAAFRYHRELEDTRRLIRGLAMRLTKLDLSRAWNKAAERGDALGARLVYLQKSQQEKLRKETVGGAGGELKILGEQQDWAARFLRDKMDRINNQSARSPAMRLGSPRWETTAAVGCCGMPWELMELKEVNLNQISSVILHSERSLEKTNKGDRLPPSSCAGVWFTINGPRVGWGRSLRKITDPETQKSVQEVVGSADGGYLGAALASGAPVQWLRMEIGIKSAEVPDLRSSLPEEGQALGQGPTGRKSSEKTARPYMGKFVAEIPLPVGEKGISALDLSEIGIDVVEQDPVDMEKNRTIWATKLLRLQAADG